MDKSKVKKVTTINHFGDHACPHCGAMFIAPPDCELKAGETKCRLCGREYAVTGKIAKQANENKRRYEKGCDKVIKEIHSPRCDRFAAGAA